jgi:hypothetical protein
MTDAFLAVESDSGGAWFAGLSAVTEAFSLASLRAGVVISQARRPLSARP